MISSPTLMGIPPELRLHIYEFALDPQPDIRTSLHDRKHLVDGDCCASLISKRYSLRCSCSTGIVATALLRVNKQIFKESMPLLWNNIEIRARVVWHWQYGDAPSVRDAIARIPFYAREHVRSLLIVDVYGTEFRQIPGYWNVVQESLPNLRKMRVHFDVNEEGAENICQRLKRFQSAAKILELRYLKVEVHQRRADVRKEVWAKEMMEEVQAEVIWFLMQTVGEGTEVDVEVCQRELRLGWFLPRM